MRWGEEKEMDFAVDVEVEQRRCIWRFQSHNRLVAFECIAMHNIEVGEAPLHSVLHCIVILFFFLTFYLMSLFF